MADLDTVLTGNQTAVADLISVAERSASVWATPRAPGKWSPSQVVEHVARTLEDGANVVSGAPSKFPTLPSFVRPLLRVLFFNRVLKKNTFPKAKTSKPFDPLAGPETPAEGSVRLEAALTVFDQACRQRVAGGQRVESTVFGSISVADYARFQELHTRHHCKQIPEPAPTPH